MANYISIINNSKSKANHHQVIKMHLTDAEEVMIGVAFLREKGLDKIEEELKRIVENSNSKICFYVGLGMGETEPSALRRLHKLLKRNASNSLVLCTPNAGIFHSKIYLFRQATKVNIIIGSANLTHNGLTTNDEVSFNVESNVGAKEYNDVIQYFKELHDLYYEADIEKLIAQYEASLHDYHEVTGPQSSFRFRRNNNLNGDLDLKQLNAYYKYYKSSEEFIPPKEREEEYQEAKGLLDTLASETPLTKKQFHDLFGPLVGHQPYVKLWHSGSIHRTTYKTLDYRASFRKLVREVVKNIDMEPGEGYAASIGYLNQLRKQDKIAGIGENIVAEMLLTLAPNKYANLNKNPLKVLNKLGKQFPRATAFNAATYQEYIDTLEQIRRILKMKTFLEVDSFFNVIYWLPDETF